MKTEWLRAHWSLARRDCVVRLQGESWRGTTRVPILSPSPTIPIASIFPGSSTPLHTTSAWRNEIVCLLLVALLCHFMPCSVDFFGRLLGRSGRLRWNWRLSCVVLGQGPFTLHHVHMTSTAHPQEIYQPHPPDSQWPCPAEIVPCREVSWLSPACPSPAYTHDADFHGRLPGISE